MRNSILLFVILVFSISACQLDPCRTKNVFIKSHKTFVEKSIEDSKEYSDEEWEEKDEQFERFVEECYEKYEDKLSKEEKKEFWIVSSRYFAHRFSSEWADHFLDSEELISSFKYIFDEVTNETSTTLNEVFDEDFKNSMEDLKKDLQEVFDEDFKNEIREIFDEDFKRDFKNSMEDLKEGLEELKTELEKIFEDEKE